MVKVTLYIRDGRKDFVDWELAVHFCIARDHKHGNGVLGKRSTCKYWACLNFILYRVNAMELL